jgi:hypothetical protein
MAKKPDNSMPALSFRLDPKIKTALEKAASDDARSVSSMVQKVLTEWLKANGYLR